jgi:hypothetical protein
MVPVLKTARSWSIPPLTLLLDGPTDWSDSRNRLLAMSLTILEAESCKGCGTPLWLGHSTDQAIQFEVEGSTCYGCAELEKSREEQNKAEPGSKRYVRAYNFFAEQEGRAGSGLPSRSASYARMRSGEWDDEE